MHAAEDGDHKEELREGTLQPFTLEPPVSYQSTGPMTSTEPGRPLEEGVVRKVAQPSPVRSAQSHRPAGWKRRRPRPRLSHKGPMPF
ncbi:apelin isoform X1 [Anguilla anguilla]|uniref:apelin isoform X1 n=1 Tax=Anguilla anguilla TaxID=7936 RepID=UPI0015AF4F32|nr:apelin isoform X1 [Anguilla anguilla]